MDLNYEDYAGNYGARSDSELMGIAHAYDSLVPAAQQALRAEFTRRGLEPPVLEESADADEMGRRWITVRRYRDLSEAIVARTLLESAGMPVYLRDENLVRLDWQVSNFIGGIRLQVDEANAAAAAELLDQPIPEEISFDEGPNFQQPQCPRCQSTDITFRGASRGAALASVHLLAIPLPLGPETWVCEACGAVWEDDREATQVEAGFPIE
jgi:hypothetical protein